MIHEVEIHDLLLLTDSEKTRPRVALGHSLLSLTERVKVSPIKISIFQTLNLNQGVNFRNAIKNVSISQNFHLEVHVRKGPLAQVIDTLFLMHSASIVKYDNPSHTLVFTQSVIGNIAKPASNILIFTESVITRMIRAMIITDLFSPISLGSAYKETCDFIATGPVVLTSPDHITLSFGNLSIDLRNPDFGESQGFESSRINRKTRAGELIIFRNPNWPKSKTLRYQFSFLKESQAKALLAFFEQTAGQEITLVDFEGRTWLGIIRTPATNVIEQGRYNYTAEFEFEGELVA